MRRADVVLSLLAVACGGSDAADRSVAETPTNARAADGRYIAWAERRIDDEELGGVPIRGGDGLEMADLDDDGFLDIVSVHEDSDHIRLAFGSGSADEWELFTLAEGEEVHAVEDVAVGDLSGDGFQDVVAACEFAHLIYFQNPGGAVRGLRWARVIPPSTRGRGSFIRVFVADVDHDGGLEVVAANKGTVETLEPDGSVIEADARPTSEISWFEVPANPLDGAGWTEHVLARVNVPINSPPVDLDGDGDIDVFGGSRGDGRVLWLENTGGTVPEFVEHPIDVVSASGLVAGAPAMTGFNVQFADLSGDGRLDAVLRADRSEVVWLAQPTDPASAWTLHRIGHIAPDHLIGLAIGDVNGDGRPDVITGAYSRGPRLQDGQQVTSADPVGRLAWFEHPPDPTGAWPRHDISRRKRGMFDAFVPRDMDDDGDIDFVGTRGNSGAYDGVFWLEQRRTARPVSAFEPARALESEHLPLPPR